MSKNPQLVHVLMIWGKGFWKKKKIIGSDIQRLLVTLMSPVNIRKKIRGSYHPILY